MIKTVILTVIVLVIPAFFALIFLSSGYHQLTGLRRRLEAAGDELKAQRARRDATSDEAGFDSDVQAAQQNYAEAVGRYQEARRTMPGKLLAGLPGFGAVHVGDLSGGPQIKRV